MSDTDWMGSANCATTDPELFTLDLGDSTRPAKRICAKCPVVQQCLQYALDNDEDTGVWGGLSVQERRALRRAAA